MRSLAILGLLAVAAMLAGCQILPYGDNRFSPTVYDEIPPRPVKFPVKFVYPDTTDFGYPLYDDAPRADLNLRSISCTQTPDGRLVVLANVRNMGADDLYRIQLLSGDLAAFRVAATLTTANGTTERVSGIRLLKLDVATDAVVTINSVQLAANDVTRIDVVADPDRVVPDPIRDNNRLSWRGSIDGANPQCTVQR